jgi:hypothetical protein
MFENGDYCMAQLLLVGQTEAFVTTIPDRGGAI